MKDLPQYLDMPGDKLARIRKQLSLGLWIMSICFIIVAGMFFFFHLYVKNYRYSILFLFVLLCVMAGSLYSRQTLRYIEIIQELKKKKNDPGDSRDG
jgi:uncharacterized membrane-anchored protein YitT (DUF2179 family)